MTIKIAIAISSLLALLAVAAQSGRAVRNSTAIRSQPPAVQSPAVSVHHPFMGLETIGHNF